jgi:RES domain-containing protein
MIVTTLGVDEVFYRVHSPQWASRPMSGMGAALRGGRFNRPEQEALYLARDAATALAEFQQDNRWLTPGTICSYFAGGLRVADLSAGFDPSQWDELWADYCIDWRREAFNLKVEPVTWYMVDTVVEAGLDGILFPSQAHAGGMNLVVYDSSTRPASQLRVHDPNGELPSDRRSWRSTP